MTERVGGRSEVRVQVDPVLVLVLVPLPEDQAADVVGHAGGQGIFQVDGLAFLLREYLEKVVDFILREWVYLVDCSLFSTVCLHFTLYRDVPQKNSLILNYISEMKIGRRVKQVVCLFCKP